MAHGKPQVAFLFVICDCKLWGGDQHQILRHGQRPPTPTHPMALQPVAVVARACPWDLVDKLMKKYAKSRSMRLLLEAHFSDVFVAPLEKLSAAGMVSDGYDGDHEIVCPFALVL